MGVKINGVGCSLIDYLYTDIDFTDPSLEKFFSLKPGDGGITPGKLVFSEEFEAFAQTPFLDAVEVITRGREPDSINIGGPAIVALINASQLLWGKGDAINFYGAMGHDETGDKIIEILSGTSVNIDHYHRTDGISPSTIVLSDPAYDDGNGERAFINNIGAAWNLTPESLDNDFFGADVLLFGATGLTPAIHDNLTVLLKRGREQNCINVVTTVFDFRNEMKDPENRWPLGESDESYQYIDLLITDREEALRLTGENSIPAALSSFSGMGTSSAIVTSGAEEIHFYSKGGLFAPHSPSTLPISGQVGRELREGTIKGGDTTGCGDNFAGGVLASLAEQVEERKEGLDLTAACSWGVVSGGFTCFHVGGMFHEKTPGEKRETIQPYYESYMKQIGAGGGRI